MQYGDDELVDGMCDTVLFSIGVVVQHLLGEQSMQGCTQQCTNIYTQYVTLYIIIMSINSMMMMWLVNITQSHHSITIITIITITIITII